MTDQLTTLDAVKAELGGSAGGLTDDYLGSLIDAASDAIVSWCGRSFGTVSATEAFSAAPTDQLMLSLRPIISVNKLSICATPYTDLSTLVIDKDGGLISFTGGWPGPNVIVTYQGGYVLPGNEGRTLPADIERAAILFVKRAVLGKDRDPALRSKGMNGMEEVGYFSGDPTSIAPDVAGLLARHCEVYV